MRVAISGTHGCGKSTLIDTFLLSHNDYLHEPEPYEMLQDLYGEDFAAEPSADDFYRQLEYHLSRSRHYDAANRVIFERCAADFLAYMLALGDLGREGADAKLVEQAMEMVADGLSRLDLIVYIPITNGSDIISEEEDLALRRAVDARLEGILINDDFGMLSGTRPSIVEAIGTMQQRLRTLESALR